MWVPLGIQHAAGLSYINASNPSSEILAQSAATMAATSLIYKDTDAAYAAMLLDHSKDLYTRASTHLGSYMQSTDPNLKTLKEWYPSSIYTDELALSAAWLYVATKDQNYLDQANSWIHNASGHENEVSTLIVQIFLWINTDFSSLVQREYPFQCHLGIR